MAKRRNAVDILRQIQIAWMETPERETLLPSILDALRIAVGVEETSILIVTPDGRELVETVIAGKKRPKGAQTRIRIATEGITGWVAAHRKAAIVKDITKDKRYIPTGVKIRAEAAVPVMIGERMLGVLNLESSKVGHFSDSDIEWLTPAAAQISLALQNEEMRQHEAKWARSFALLHHLSRVAFGVIPPRAFLRRVVDAMRTHFECHYTAVLLGDYSREELVLLAQSCAEAGTPAIGTRLKFSHGLIGNAFRLGETVNVPDVSKDPLYVSAIPGILSEVCVPLRIGDRCFGILDAQAKEHASFDQDEVMFLETLSRWLVPAVTDVTPEEIASWASTTR